MERDEVLVLLEDHITENFVKLNTLLQVFSSFVTHVVGRSAKTTFGKLSVFPNVL